MRFALAAGRALLTKMLKVFAITRRLIEIDLRLIGVSTVMRRGVMGNNTNVALHSTIIAAMATMASIDTSNCNYCNSHWQLCGVNCEKLSGSLMFLKITRIFFF